MPKGKRCWVGSTPRRVIDASEPFDGNALLRRLADDIQTRLAKAGAEIAHLKMTLSPERGKDLGVLNLVRGDASAESIHRLQDDMDAGELLVNLRAEADPELLREAVLAALEALRPAVNVKIEPTSPRRSRRRRRSAARS